MHKESKVKFPEFDPLDCSNTRKQAREFEDKYNPLLKNAELVVLGGLSEDGGAMFSFGWKFWIDGNKYGNFIFVVELPDNDLQAKKIIELLQINADESRLLLKAA